MKLEQENMKQHILNILLDELRRCNIERITVSQLIKDAYVSRSTFYRCFDSIEDALSTLIEQSSDEFLSSLMVSKDILASPDEFLENFSSSLDKMLHIYQPVYENNAELTQKTIMHALRNKLMLESDVLTTNEKILIGGIFWKTLEMFFSDENKLCNIKHTLPATSKEKFDTPEVSFIHKCLHFVHDNVTKLSFLKPSKFNILVPDGNEFILYNSRSGTKSICRVPEQYTNEIRALFSKSRIPEQIIELLFPQFISDGFFVDENTNEDELLHHDFEEYVDSEELILVLTVTTECNFACIYCSQEYIPQKMTQETQDGVVSFLRMHISEFRSIHVEWFGGEPLLCGQLICSLSERILDICRKAGRPYTAAITTNGYLMTEELFRKLYRCHVNAWQITLDGKENLHNLHRPLKNGKGTYTTITENIQLILQNVKTRNFRVTIRTNFSVDSMNQMADILNEYERLFGKDDRVIYMVRAAEDWGGERIKSFSKLLTVEEQSDIFSQIVDIGTSLKFYGNYAALEPMGSICHAAKKNMYNIGPNGDIYKCDSCIHETRIGFLQQDGNMVFEKTMYEIRSDICIDKTSDCMKCTFAGSCVMGGCPRRVIEGLPHYCGFEKKNLTGLLRLFCTQFDVKKVEPENIS